MEPQVNDANNQDSALHIGVDINKVGKEFVRRCELRKRMEAECEKVTIYNGFPEITEKAGAKIEL